MTTVETTDPVFDPSWRWRQLGTATHRYWLDRSWMFGSGTLAWCMLNPSTATDLADDPTIRRTQSFSQRAGYGGEIVTNIWPIRSTDPAGLRDYHPDARELELADRCIVEAAELCGSIVVAWGVHGAYRDRGVRVLSLLASSKCRVLALGVTKEGHPKHPLYVAGKTALRTMRELLEAA